MVSAGGNKIPNKMQLSMMQFVKKIDRGQNLYDTASNVNVLRELRGKCVVRDSHCQEHDRPARKITTWRSIWTKNVKTGIFGYRRKKVSVLHCDGTTRILVGTRDSAVSNKGALSVTE